MATTGRRRDGTAFIRATGKGAGSGFTNLGSDQAREGLGDAPEQIAGSGSSSQHGSDAPAGVSAAYERLATLSPELAADLSQLSSDALEVTAELKAAQEEWDYSLGMRSSSSYGLSDKGWRNSVKELGVTVRSSPENLDEAFDSVLDTFGVSADSVYPAEVRKLLTEREGHIPVEQAEVEAEVSRRLALQETMAQAQAVILEDRVRSTPSSPSSYDHKPFYVDNGYEFHGNSRREEEGSQAEQLRASLAAPRNRGVTTTRDALMGVREQYLALSARAVMLEALSRRETGLLGLSRKGRLAAALAYIYESQARELRRGCLGDRYASPLGAFGGADRVVTGRPDDKR